MRNKTGDVRRGHESEVPVNGFRLEAGMTGMQRSSRGGAQVQSAGLERTPLYEAHVARGARMVPFAGWEMPVQYDSILGEARAVRSGAGVFDVSHMGRVEVQGPGAGGLLSRVLSVGVTRLRLGRARYNLICNERGGVIDDSLVYRRSENLYLLVPNASNTREVVEWLLRWRTGTDGATVENVTRRHGMIALQGPEAAGILDGLTDADPAALRRFAALDMDVSGVPAFVSRTGYTGEDGFELIVAGESVLDVWEALVSSGAAPCGLGARDVLRLEAGLPLHGNDLDAATNPYEAGLGRFVDPDREGYVAGEALRGVRDSGPDRHLVGLEVLGRAIPRHGYAISADGEAVGSVTSGSFSPTLDSSIGMGYVPTGREKVGSRLQIDVRGRPVDAAVAALPFYVRGRNS